MADKAKTEVFDHGKGMVIIMKKEYTMNFNMGSCSWEPVCVHAALQIGADDTGDLMPLFHNFTVEDAPDMRYGAGGISSKILSISNKKILKDGKTAEFYVSIIPPTSSAERDRMIKIIGDQMSFALKVTLNPATGFLPGAPVSVVNSMVKSTSGTVTILLTLPPDRISVDPKDDPLIIETNIEKTVSIRPTCERINFETLQYEIMRDAAGKPILPLLSMKSPIKEKKLPLKYELTEKDGLTIVDLTPVRFFVGDGTPVTVFDMQIKRPEVIERTEPEILTKTIQCTTNPLETEFRIMKGNKEMFRETKHVYGDLLDVKVVSEDSNMKWDDMTLLYQINNAGAFFNKSHFDTGKFSLKESQELEINIIRNKEDAETRDSVTLEIAQQPFSGILHVYKHGWKLLDDDIANLLPDAGGSLEERLTGAILEVTAKAEFVSAYKTLSIDVEDISVIDILGRFITFEEEIQGVSKNGILRFQMPGEPVKNKIVKLEVKLSVDEYVKETLEEIHTRACEVDAGLGTEVSYFGRGIISLLARSQEDEVKEFISGLFDKLGLTESFFTKYSIMKKYLEFSFKLRDNAAKRIFNNFVSLLVELASGFVEWGISQGSIANVDSISLQQRLLNQTNIKQTLEAKTEALKVAAKQTGDKIPLMEESLLQISHDIEISKKFLTKFEEALTKKATPNLKEVVKRWQGKVALQELSVKTIPKKIAENQKAIRELELKISQMANKQGLCKAEFDVLLKEMRGEIGLLYTAGRETYEEMNKNAYSYENLSEILSTASENLCRAFYEYIGTWEESFKAEDNVKPVISEVYRNRYANYLTNSDIKMNNEGSEISARALSGKELIALVQSGQKPPANWVDAQRQKWSGQDKKQKQAFEDHVRNLARDYLRIDTDNKEWVNNLNSDSFKTVCKGIDQLVSFMKDYEKAFDEGMFVSPTDISTWQDVDNLVNMMSFLTSTLVRVVSGITLLTGIGAPMALLLSKIGDIIDLLGAGTQVVIAAFLTMPEMNGMAEAVPLLASMLHNGLSATDAVFDENIINA